MEGRRSKTNTNNNNSKGTTTLNSEEEKKKLNVENSNSDSNKRKAPESIDINAANSKKIKEMKSSIPDLSSRNNVHIPLTKKELQAITFYELHKVEEEKKLNSELLSLKQQLEDLMKELEFKDQTIDMLKRILEQKNSYIHSITDYRSIPQELADNWMTLAKTLNLIQQ